MAPGTGFEPATSKLTASCSTAELSRITHQQIVDYRGKLYVYIDESSTQSIKCLNTQDYQLLKSQHPE